MNNYLIDTDCWRTVVNTIMRRGIDTTYQLQSEYDTYVLDCYISPDITYRLGLNVEFECASIWDRSKLYIKYGKNKYDTIILNGTSASSTIICEYLTKISQCSKVLVHKSYSELQKKLSVCEEIEFLDALQNLFYKPDSGLTKLARINS